MADAAEKQADGPRDAAQSGRKIMLKAMVLCLALAAALVVLYLTPLRDCLKEVHKVSDAVKDLGIWGPAAFTLATGALVAIGVPRLAICPIAGLTFGFWWGLLWIQAGAMLGYYGLFLFARWAGREMLLRHWPAVDRWAAVFTERSVAGIVLLRTLPIHGALSSLVLGVSNARHRDYLIGTMLGTAPESAGFTLIGAGLLQRSPWVAVGCFAAAVAVLAAVWIVWMVYTRRARRGPDPGPTAAPVQQPQT